MPFIKTLTSKQIKFEFSSEAKVFKKYHKIKYKSKLPTLSTIRGGLSLVTTRHAVLKVKQLVTLLKIVKPALKSIVGAKVTLALKPDIILTAKPKDIRMGRGKGAPSERVNMFKAGSKFFTLYNVNGLQTNSTVMKTCKSKFTKSTLIAAGK